MSKGDMCDVVEQSYCPNALPLIFGEAIDALSLKVLDDFSG
jgi:hypothetical protein